jgi:TPR repeat protein/S1-C subfamily serine protease
VKRAFLFLAALILLPQLAIADFDRGLEAYHRGDYATALKEFRAGAEQGDMDAQYGLGVIYRDGQGVTEDVVEALRWFELAATQGYAMAQFNIGVIYAYGQGVPKNDAQAARWFHQAAEQGLASAQFELGIIYANGNGVQQDNAEAVRLYRLAAEQGHASAQNNLGVMYEFGQGVSKDEGEAVRWYRLAAEQGLALAQSNLGIMYAYGIGVTENVKEAAIWFRAAAEQGNIRAQKWLALMYKEGFGVPKNEAEAAQWYKIAALIGDADAQYRLGRMYDFGQGVPKDKAEAVRWYRLAAEQGHAEGQMDLGVMYRTGSGVPENDAEAVKWYKRAAEQGDASAQSLLSESYFTGEGVTKDYVLAYKWGCLAAEGHSFYPKKKLEILELFYMNKNQLSEARQLVAAFQPRVEMEVDYDEWWVANQRHKISLEAAEHGDVDAMFKTGSNYKSGYGVSKNEEEAVRWFKQAAEQGHMVAQSSLGSVYHEGTSGIINYTEAARWYRRAAEQGYSLAQLYLGLLYRKGDGVPKNYVLAYKWISLHGSDSYTGHLPELESLMTREQIAEAQRLAAEFRPRKEKPGQQFTTAPSVAQPRATPSPSVPAATVKRIQAHLAALGYDPGPADGMIGPRTTQAIRAFQRDAGIEPDGIASSTLEALLAVLVEEKGQKKTPTPKADELKLVSTGTGFFVNNQGHVLTNQHVVESCSQVRVTVPAGTTDASIQAVHQNDDLALLLTSAKAPAIASFRRTVAEVGEDISVVGYPLHGLLGGLNITSGSVASATGLLGDARYLQISAPVQPGNSGGPLLDSAGTVLGVVVAKLDAIAVAQATGDIPQNVNFAIKSAVARSFLSIHGIEYQEASPRRVKTRVAIAAEAQQHTVLIECWK